jgi:hypothetical protein
VLAPATVAALPSTRAIETRLLPTSLAATHRGFAFYVASPKSSIPGIATCSMSQMPSARIDSCAPANFVVEALQVALASAELGGIS